MQQIAAAHKAAWAGINGALEDPLALAGIFEINGQAIALEATESLLDLRDRINAANAGANATGVTASIVAISDGRHVLILTADETGTDAASGVADTGGSVLQDLGLTDGGGGFRNELQETRNALLLVDGLGTRIERQSNTVDDVFSGVTLSLFKAEAGTRINLDLERDLNQVKSAARSARRSRPPIRRSRCWPRSASPSRARARSAIRCWPTRSRSTSQARQRAADQDRRGARAVLVPDVELEPERGAGRLRRHHQLQRGRLHPDVAYADGAIVSANIGGAADGSDDGSVVVSGKLLKVVEGGAEGLQLLYTGTGAASGIQLDLSVGIGAQI